MKRTESFFSFLKALDTSPSYIVDTILAWNAKYCILCVATNTIIKAV